MEEGNLIQKEVKCQQELLEVYTESKNLFIRAEELLAEMKFFVAPILEAVDKVIWNVFKSINLC